jgi:[CysO sulfur-carrier protein]-S-L-cysteine hydrolase
VLRLDRATFERIVAHAYDELPHEMCGLLAGRPAGGGSTAAQEAGAGDGGATVTWFYPCRNAAGSARVYTVEPRDHLRADRDAEQHGWEIIGVVHSHTHTPAHPSPTDLAQAPDPAWHYAIVSLADQVPSLRSWRIEAGNGSEEAVVVPDWLDSLVD